MDRIHHVHPRLPPHPRRPALDLIRRPDHPIEVALEVRLGLDRRDDKRDVGLSERVEQLLVVAAEKPDHLGIVHRGLLVGDGIPIELETAGKRCVCGESLVDAEGAELVGEVARGSQHVELGHGPESVRSFPPRDRVRRACITGTTPYFRCLSGNSSLAARLPCNYTSILHSGRATSPGRRGVLRKMMPTSNPLDRRTARRAAWIAGYCLMGVGLVGFVLGPLLIPQLADALGVDPPATGIAQELGFALLIAGSLLAAVGHERWRRGSRTSTETVRSYPVAGGTPDAGRMANQLSQLSDDDLRDFVRGLDRESELWSAKGGYEWALENAPTPEARAQIQRVLDVFPPGPGFRLPPGGIHFPRWGSAADDVATFADEVSQLPDESVRHFMRTAPQEVRAGLDWAWQHAPTPEARAQVQRVLDAFPPAGSPPA